MEAQKKTASIIKNGVQIIYFQSGLTLLEKKVLLIRDKDDRGTGTGIIKYGLPGGGIEECEDPISAAQREMHEETGIYLLLRKLALFGIFTKERANGSINQNYLFCSENETQKKIFLTQDFVEVSRVENLFLSEILKLWFRGLLHEGSIRLILNWLNGINSGSLNKPVIWNDIYF